MTNRRNFIKKTTLAGAAVTFGGLVNPGLGYAGLFGANEKLNLAIIGVHSRAKAIIKGINEYSDAKIIINCDVDGKVLKEHSQWCQENIGYVPLEEKDFRKVLENKDIDAVFIATPDHWHAPLAILALQAGKHVYVEKPCSHNPHENELLIAAQKKYGKVVQMGNQTRSSSQHAQAAKEIKEGIIGDVYKGEAYYSNNRPSIGKGKIIDVPSYFEWDLWQGPAPREKYKDNIHPYNWHWFKKWGTGEVCNNGLHEIDVLRWMLDVDLPESVTSFGGKYTHQDDWEFPDNQEVTYQFKNDKRILYKGHSRGEIVTNPPNAIIYGSKGAIEFSKNDYKILDLEGKPVGKEKEMKPMNSRDTVGADPRTAAHVANFCNSIREGVKLNSPITEGGISTMLCHYGNITHFSEDTTLYIDQSSGKIKNNPKAMAYWKREYAPGWEPKL